MKHFILLLLFFTPTFLSAQNKEGTITYEATTKLEINFKLDGVDMEHIKSMIPKSNVVKKELLFTEKHSTYRDIKGEKADDAPMPDSQSEGVVIKFSGANNEDELYADHVKQTTVEKKDFLGRQFLISGEANKLKWKITGKQKEILGYQCQQATVLRDTIQTIAWFAPQIPVSSGPDGHGNLPGMILELDINDGQRVTTATNITFSSDVDSKITSPKKGKPVSKEKFKKIVEAKMKEMGDVRSGNTVIKIIEQ